jgi:hypothetical protein
MELTAGEPVDDSVMALSYCAQLGSVNDGTTYKLINFAVMKITSKGVLGHQETGTILAGYSYEDGQWIIPLLGASNRF